MDEMGQVTAFMQLLTGAGRTLAPGEGPLAAYGVLVYSVDNAGKASTVQALLTQLGLCYSVDYKREEVKPEAPARRLVYGERTPAVAIKESWRIVAYLPQDCLLDAPEQVGEVLIEAERNEIE